MCVPSPNNIIKQKEDKAKIIEKYKVGDIIKNAIVKDIALLVVFLM